jgi:hypothetical protein
MPDIAIVGDKTFLFEKLLEEAGRDHQFVKPGVLGSPFLPRFRMVLIPTGFANPQYSKVLPALKAARSRIAEFLERGGILTVFGPLVPEHDYDWLPLPLKYVGEYESTGLVPASDHRCSCLVGAKEADCDGYLIPGDEFETILTDAGGRSVLVIGKYGRGKIVATTIHEFPSTDYLCWAAEEGKPAKI